MKTIDHISWEVTQFTNEYGDEKPPYRDIPTTATHPKSKRKAAKKAMIEFYKQALSRVFKKMDAD